MYVCMYMCVRVLSVCVYVFACVCLCLHVCICVWVCMCVCMWACVYECMAMRSRERSKEKAQKTWSSASHQWRIGVEMSNRNFRQIYLYEFKLGRTAAQTARNINEVWGQGSLNECTVQRVRRSRSAQNDTRHCEGTQCPSHYNCSPFEANWED
ncbi:hypothetical protein V3C99_018704 [Haemonchus contortus]